MELTENCQKAGACAWGIVYPEDVDCSALRQRYGTWLATGNAGALSYVDERLDLLCNPFGVRPQAKCALVIGFQARLDEASPLLALPAAGEGSVPVRIAGYAMDEDYHITGMGILKQIGEALGGWSEACVDSKPLPEKEFAELAGVGVRGLNSLMYLPDYGCRFYLGVLFVDRRLAKNPSQENSAGKTCVQCGRCVRSCPVQALSDKGKINVYRCRSWLAGQKRGALTNEEQQLLGDSLFGCSVCSSCCPDDQLSSRDYLVDAEALFFMSSSKLRGIIAGTALEHTGVSVLKRNAAVAICRAKPEMIPKLLSGTDSPSIQLTISNWKVR